MTEVSNSQNLNEALDLLDELRERAAQSERQAKERIAERYIRRVVVRRFEVKDLVLRRADVGNKNAHEGKLAPNWEGPYRVTSKLGGGAYTLETLEGKAIPRAWNVDKLRRYYS